MINVIVEIYEEPESGEARMWGFEIRDRYKAVGSTYEHMAIVTGKTHRYIVVSDDFIVTSDWALEVAKKFHKCAMKVNLSE